MFSAKRVGVGGMLLGLILGIGSACNNPVSSDKDNLPGTIEISLSDAPLKEIYIAKQGEAYGTNLIAGTYQSRGTTFRKEVEGGYAYTVKVQISDAGSPNAAFATVYVGAGQTRGLWSHEICNSGSVWVMCTAFLDVVN
jgi:hypothetical protein